MQTARECGDDITRPQRHVGGMTEIPIILLAAGQSSRMGGVDKLMQEVDGVPLLRRSALIARNVAPVIVALPCAPHPRHSTLEGLDVQIVQIPDAAEGINASLRGALAHVPSQAKAAMIVLADLPELTSSDLTAILQARITHPNYLIWRGATEAGKAGHPVLFDQSVLPALSGLTGDSGAQDVVRAHKDKVFLQPLPNRNALLDLDTPEDWAAWHKTRLPK